MRFQVVERGAGKTRSRMAMAAALALTLVRCAPAPKPAPVAVAPEGTAPAPAAPVDWRDLALTPGRWTYLPGASTPSAQFARAGAAADFTISCDRKNHNVVLFRLGRSAGPLTITTSFAGLGFPAQSAGDGVSVTLSATNDFLDRIAFSRGHVTVAAPGLPLLVLPAWAEPARVIEDCRS